MMRTVTHRNAITDVINYRQLLWFLYLTNERNSNNCLIEYNIYLVDISVGLSPTLF